MTRPTVADNLGVKHFFFCFFFEIKLDAKATAAKIIISASKEVLCISFLSFLRYVSNAYAKQLSKLKIKII